MEFINNLVQWTEKTFTPLGAWGLFLLAFMESSFFPIPPDILLIVLTLAKPEWALFYALVCTIGSILGGMFGYYIGWMGERAVLEKLISKKKIEKAHNLFQKYDAWAIFIAAFTPLPYKVFTITAGLFYVNFKRFVIASALGRAMRFFVVAILVAWLGESMVSFINDYFNILSLVFVIVLIVGYIGYKKIYKKDKRKGNIKGNEKGKRTG